VTRQPTTERGEAIVDAAREMADAAERAATAYERGSVLARSGAEDEAATARAEIDRLIADFEDALSASEERARKAEQQAADAAGLLVLAERQLSEWKATAVRGAEMVRAAEGRGVSLFAAGYWADTVLAQTKPDIDPAAGTSDHELEPGRNDVNG